MKAYVICLNDFPEFVVIDFNDKDAKKKMKSLKDLAYNKHKVSCGNDKTMLKEHKMRYRWHLEKTDFACQSLSNRNCESL